VPDDPKRKLRSISVRWAKDRSNPGIQLRSNRTHSQRIHNYIRYIHSTNGRSPNCHLPEFLARSSLNLPIDLPDPFVALAVTVVVCIARAGIENRFFFRSVSSFRFGEAEMLHLTFGGGQNSAMVGESTASSGSALSGENSPDVEIEVERYPLAPAEVNAPMLLFTPALEASRSLLWPVVNPDLDGLSSLNFSRICR
jgi:hypothetical protein